MLHIQLNRFCLPTPRPAKLQELKELLLRADSLVLATPVYFGDRSLLIGNLIDLIRGDPELKAALAGKIMGGIAVAAKQNGGQETSPIYQLMDILDIGLLGVGNDWRATAQYGGTCHAGDVGMMASDSVGIDKKSRCIIKRRDDDMQGVYEALRNADVIPNCKAYDPAFAGEMAVIIDHGMREMLVEQKDVFYYVTLMNENYAQPDLPEGAEAGVINGCYKFASYTRSSDEGYRLNSLKEVTLMGSGAILTEVIKAAQLLAE